MTGSTSRGFSSMAVLLLFANLCQAGPTWTENSAPLLTARGHHTATLLTDETVLVTGGEQGNNAMADAERYDPATNIWTPAGTLTQRRFRHTATLLTNGKVLVAGGMYYTYVTDTLIAVPQSELYDPATNSWTTDGMSNTARYNQTATLLPNGKILVVGGVGQSGSALASAEIYDPDAHTWSTVANMNAPRYAHTTTLLMDGRVLVVGGTSDGTALLSSAEVYDPTNNAWSPAADVPVARGFHVATLLPNGRVIVSGGYDQTHAAITDSEIYDPATNTWAPAAPSSVARYLARATLLPSGQVFVSGGDDTFGNPTYAAPEIYVPLPTDAWISGGSSTSAVNASWRDSQTDTLLATGQILIAGGHDGGLILASTALGNAVTTSSRSGAALRRAHRYAQTTLLPRGKVLLAGGYGYYGPELFDPATNSWSDAPGPSVALQSSTLLTDGRVLLVGGGSSNLYDDATKTWQPAAYPSVARVFHSATLLADGGVLIAGGFDSNNPIASLASAERYSPTTGTWSAAASLNIPREGHTATLLANGKVLVAGGNNGSVLAEGEVYDPQNNTWSAGYHLVTARSAHTATLLPSGRVLLAGGYNNIDRALAQCELYDPQTGTALPAGPMNSARQGHTATLLPNGTVLVTGGVGSDGALASAEIYDPTGNAWSSAADLAVARADHSATLLTDGTVLIAAGDPDSSTGLSSTEIFDPGLALQPTRQPTLSSVPTLLTGTSKIQIHGAGFRPNLEGSGGDMQGSTSNHPSVQVRRLDNGQMQWLALDSSNPFTATSFTSVDSALAGFAHGHVLVTVFVNGIPSAAQITVFNPDDPIFANGFE